MLWDIKLDGVSIKHQIASFDLHKSRALFCSELTLILHDKSFLDQFDFTEIPTEPRLEVLTEVGGNWQSEGTFFIEDPGTTQDKGEIKHTIYGRDESARLTFPFAARISKEWADETTLFGIIEEIIEEAGLEYDASRMMINDYTIYPSTYSVTYRYPLEILQELVGKTDGFLYTTRLGKLWVFKDAYTWTDADTEIPPGQIQNIIERTEYPEFGNRIRVGSFSKTNDPNISISLEMDETYVACGEGVGAKAVVTFLDNSPVSDGYPVSWSSDNNSYASWENIVTHVYTHRITDEAQTASSRYQVSTTYPIRQVHSVTEVSTGETKAVAGFSGSTISLSEPLSFTNSRVLIDYETGYATNTLIAGSPGEVEVNVHALVETFVRDTVTVRIDTASGSQQAEEDMYVTVVVKDFMTEEEIASAAVALDGAAKGNTDASGSLDLGLIEGGEHSIRITKTGYKPTSSPDDGLDNDTIRVAQRIYTTEEDEETTDVITKHNKLTDIQGGQSGQYYHLTAAEYAALSAYSVIGHTHDDRYYTETEVDALFTAHVGAADPHTVYPLDTEVVKRDGTAELTSPWDIGAGMAIYGEKFRSRSGGSIALYEDADRGVLVNDGGIIDMAYQSACRMYRATSYQAVGTGAWTKIQLNAEEWDIQGEADITTNYRYTATKAGKVKVSAGVQVQNTNILADHSVWIAIYKNGAAMAKAVFHTSWVAFLAVPIAADVVVAIGDYIELYLWHNMGANIQVSYNNENTHMEVRKVM